MSDKQIIKNITAKRMLDTPDITLFGLVLKCPVTGKKVNDSCPVEEIRRLAAIDSSEELLKAIEVIEKTEKKAIIKKHFNCPLSPLS